MDQPHFARHIDHWDVFYFLLERRGDYHPVLMYLGEDDAVYSLRWKAQDSYHVEYISPRGDEPWVQRMYELSKDLP